MKIFRRTTTPVVVERDPAQTAGLYRSVPSRSGAQPTPKAGTPILGVPIAGYAKAMALASSQGGNRLENARAAILGFHQLFRDQIDVGGLMPHITVEVVRLYKETNYVRDILKTNVSMGELLMIEGFVNSYCLLGLPTELPAELAEMHHANLRYAEFLAGFFALAHGRTESAADHFLKADMTWEIDPQKMAALLKEGKKAEAGELIGEPYKRLVSRLGGEAAAVPDDRRATMAIPLFRDLPTTEVKK